MSQIRVRLVAAVFVCLFAAAPTAWAASIDLAAPSAPSFSAAVGTSRSVILRDDVNLVLTSFGIRMDPLVGLFNLTAELFAYDLTTNTRGALLASNSQGFTDLGLAFYDVALAGSLTAGNAYELQMKSLASGSFSVEFYGFDNPAGLGPNSPYAAGPVTVIDGAGETVGGRSNFVLAHFQLNGDAAAVPEPGSLLLLGSGVAMFWKKRRRASAR